MKHLKKFIIPIIAIAIGCNISCERDDICPQDVSTTPKLLIDLLDNDNRENKKNASRLLVTVNVDGNIVAVSGYEGINQQSDLILPLRTDEDTTVFDLVLEAEFNNNNELTGGNTDRIVITYTREQVYVSRACGYKTIFTNINVEIVDDSENWLIGSPENLTENDTVENENATHFNFFH